MSTIAQMVLSGVASAKPSAGIVGRLYCATDNLLIYRDNGASWDIATNVAGGGGGGGALPGPDVPPVTPGSLDDEFTDVTWNTNAKWSWVNQTPPGATAVQSLSWLGLSATGHVSANPASIVQPMPSGVWEVTAKISFASLQMPTGNNTCGGLCVMDGATGNETIFYRGGGSGGGNQFIGLLRPGSAWVTGISMPYSGPLYMRVHDDGTNFIYSYSQDGVNWTVHTSEPRTTWHTTPSKVGISIYADGAVGQAATVGADFFRRTV